MPFCPNCNAELGVNDQLCTRCGATFGSDSAWQPSATPRAEKAALRQPAWYETTRGVVGIFILSFALYSHVLITVMAGAALQRNEVAYLTAWTSFIFYAAWRRKKWNGWIGAGIGALSGIAIVLLANTRGLRP